MTRVTGIRRWRTRLALPFMAVLASASGAMAQGSPGGLLYTFAPPLTGAASRTPGREPARRGRPVRVEGGAVASASGVASTLRVPLPDGRIVTAVRRRVEPLADGGTYWSGTWQGTHAGHVRLVRRRDVIVGMMEVDGTTYELNPGAAGHHLLGDGDSRVVRCGGARAPAIGLTPDPAPMAPARRVQAADTTAPVVDLLLVFTPDARAASGGDDGMRATAELAVAATNEALENSLVDARVRLVDVRVVAYVESRSMNVDLDRLTTSSDGHLDDVHGLRETSGADLVSLVVEQNSEGFDGLAWLMQQPSAAFGSLAFSVVMRRSAATLTLAHEIGHNLGLNHDRANASSPGAYPFAYGYRDPPYFRDLMSYACLGTPCPRVPHFSNPEVSYGGRPTGRADLEDAARALRLTIPVAAQFGTSRGPLLTSASPATVPTLGGVRVTLQGARLWTVTRVRVGGADATGLVATAADTLSIVVPRRPQGGADVVVEDDTGAASTLPGSLVYVPSVADADGDALEDDWERAMGLDAAVGTGPDGPDGDPDKDDLGNLRERLEHGHPTGRYRRYLAEGASGPFFATQLALVNPSSTATGAVIRFLSADGTARSQWLSVPALTRRTFTGPEIALHASAEFSIVVESQAPLVVDRTLSWDASHYGAHAETSMPAPALRWYLAEGATTGGFALFYLLQNPGDSTANVRVQYLRALGRPLEKTYVLAPRSRTNIWVNREEFPGEGLALAAAEVSAVVSVESGPPIVVERSMYRDLPGQIFGAGHASAGVTAAATAWFLAEGATGPYFDLFVLMANPGADAATVDVSFLLPDGSTVEKAYVVAPASRFTVWVDHEDARLANTAVSTTVRSTNGVPIVVERAMWWPGSSSTWTEAHNSPGSTTTAARWALAEGEVGGPGQRETYVLVANTSTSPVDVRVTLLFESGASAVRSYTLAGRSRFNVDVRTAFPEAFGRRFGTLVETADGSTGLAVERAMYWDAAGQRWAAGTSALGSPLP